MQLPARIGKYELEEFLGGGMARVYRARDTVIGRTVAVKILTEEGCADEETKSRFLQEARLAGNITHDNIISIYDFGEDAEGRPFMVMEFLKGEDLRHAIKNGSMGDTRAKLRIALDIARALEHIHSQNIIHRDIKPDNVHLTPAGAVKLMDFGISKMQSSTRTTTGVVMGTPYYMSPEQVLGKNITPAVDIYAFGVLVFELMTGSRPVVGDTVERIFYQILQEPLNVEPMRVAGISQPIIDLVCRCTEKDPANRPQGFGEVCTQIQNIINDWDAPTRPNRSPQFTPVRPRAARKPWLLPAVIAAMVLVLVGVYFGLRPTKKQSAAAPAVVPAPKAELAKSLPFDSGEMVLIPAGTFLFGQDKQSLTLPATYIDKTEVSVEAYSRFCAAKGRPMPPGAAGERPDDPIVDITFLDAQEFAKWAGKRLPSMQEWEKAARGTDGRLYPWGEPRSPQPANIGHPNGGVMAVASFSEAASPSGALNMLGNVWEWVDELKTPSAQALQHFSTLKPPPTAAEPWYVIRGGSYNERLSDAYLWDFATVPARFHRKDIGFRCAKTP
jgi:serine/threonine protein kinase